MKPIIFMLFISMVHNTALAEYKVPKQEIANLIDATKLPTTLVSPNGKYMAIMTPSGIPSIRQVAEPEFKLAGLRFSPRTFALSRIRRTFSHIEIIDSQSRKKLGAMQVDNSRLAYIKWSPASTHLSFIEIKKSEQTLEVLNIKPFSKKRLKTKLLNSLNGRGSYKWSYDGKSIYYLARTENRTSAASADIPYNSRKFWEVIYSPNLSRSYTVTPR